MRRTPTALALLGAALALCALGAGPAAAAGGSAWWQLLSGSRPTNLRVAPDQSELQEVKTTESGGSFAAKVEVGGEVVGCLGAGEFSFLCGETGHPPVASAEALQAMLEATPQYSEGEGVKVSGGPVGGGAFLIATPGRWVAQPVRVTPLSVGETVLGSASTQVISEGSGLLTITLTNLGNAEADATGDTLQIHDSLPKGAQAYEARAVAGGTGEAGPVECTIDEVEETSQLECSFEGKLPPYEAIEVEVPVALKEGAGKEAGEVSVSGGEATGVSRSQTLNVSDAPVPFGLEYFSMRTEEEGGVGVSADGAPEASAAGSQPFQLTTTIVANSGRQIGSNHVAGPDVARVEQPALPRNLRFTLPAGLVGNVTKVETCEMATFLHQVPGVLVNECPDDAAIGASSVTFIEGENVGFRRIAVPVFNLVPGRGEPARFGLMIGGDPVVIDTSVNPSDSYRISAEVRNITQVAQFLASTTTLWGNPGAASHDASRGWKCVYHYFGSEEIPGTCGHPGPSERNLAPFLRMPVSCAAPLPFLAAFEPWNRPLGAEVIHASAESPAPGACNRVPLDPSISNALTSRLASNPSGLDFELALPNQWPSEADPESRIEGQPKKVEVAFPEGLTINPSQAEGLATCSEADYARERYDSGPAEGCPEASKIGSVRISTPLLAEEPTGALYVATPYENPTHSLIGLYLIAKVPDRGVLVKQPIEVRPDPATGRLVGISDDIPQLPFSSFALHFREGGRSPLITPPGCGTFTTTARFTPWSAQDPDNPAPSEVVERTATFTIERGVNGGACPSGDAPFHPGFEASAENDQAGAYSPFQMRITRSDGEQDITRFSSVLPPGVLGRLAGIPYCPEAGIARAQSRQGPHGGAEEKSDPSCPAASEIGTTTAGAGVGSQLTYVSGRLYLAGPYHGDPLSVVAITPAVAGPFDAGTVLVREALTLDPITARVQADGSASDPIPHILKGIPLNVRDLRVMVDRPRFTLNATSCEEAQAQATIWGGGTALAPLADHPVDLASRYQAAGCASLGFKPKLGLRLKGGTRRGAHPALRAVVRPRPFKDANFSRAVVTLPHSAFLEQAHIRTICTRVQFAAGPGNGARCPKGSVYGHAKAWSPLLDEPLKGPVFLRSSNHNLPDLVVALHGLVNIDLVARIDSVHGGIRSTFTNIPDAPVSRFVLAMQGGKKGLIVNSRNLCFKPKRNRARANLGAQNGRRRLLKPLLRAQRCAKAKRKRHRRHRSRRS